MHTQDIYFQLERIKFFDHYYWMFPHECVNRIEKAIWSRSKNPQLVIADLVRGIASVNRNLHYLVEMVIFSIINPDLTSSDPLIKWDQKYCKDLMTCLYANVAKIKSGRCRIVKANSYIDHPFLSWIVHHGIGIDKKVIINNINTSEIWVKDSMPLIDILGLILNTAQSPRENTMTGHIR
jgi:hypothetical protein